MAGLVDCAFEAGLLHCRAVGAALAQSAIVAAAVVDAKGLRGELGQRRGLGWQQKMSLGVFFSGAVFLGFATLKLFRYKFKE